MSRSRRKASGSRLVAIAESLESRMLLAYTTTGPLDINALVSAGRATVSASTTDIGSTYHIFDANTSTLARSASINPMTIQVNFTFPKTLRKFQGYFSHASGNPAYRWEVETANSQSDLDSHIGSYKLAVPFTGTPADQYSIVKLANPVTARIARLTVQRLTGDNYVHIEEWALIGDTTITSLAIDPASQSLAQYTQKQYKALATDGDGVGTDFTSRVTWSSSDPAIATADAAGLVKAVAAGECNIAASFADLSASSHLTVTPYATQQVDLNVTYIERTPRYNYDAAKNLPAPGDTVTFRGHIRNWSNLTPSVEYLWQLDGATVATGTLTNLIPDEERIVEFPWTWQTGDHSLKLVIDPINNVVESSELNNSVEIRTNGISVGFWVEQSLYNNFHLYQKLLGIGSNSWEDWAQRQMARWNQYNIDAVYPATPNGVQDRVFVDKITVVRDGTLPLHGGIAGNNPDSADKTVDLMWGFPSSGLDGTFYSNHTSKADDNPFYFEPSLVHEMGHARYLIDNYGYDIANNSDVTQVQITENGQPVAGTSLMPWLAWDSVLYYNQYGGVMTGPWHGWSPFEAACLNRIAGKRASQGNQNAPGNIGVFLNDLPQDNHVRFVNTAGQPMAGANIRLYRSVGGGGWYGKTIDDTYDLEFTTDADGYVLMPRNPFADGNIVHTYGYANGIAVLRIQKDSTVWYRFMEVPAFNLEYWKGNTQDAYYTFELPALNSFPDIELQGYERIIPKGDTTPSLDDQTDFGTIDVNAAPVTRTFVIKNRGGTYLSVTGNRVTITGTNAADFSVLKMPFDRVNPETVSPFQIKFTPTSFGLRKAIVTVTSNAPGKTSYTFAIQATATGTPFATYSPGILWVYGTDADDNISITQAGSNLQVMRNGLIKTFPNATVSSVKLEPGSGNNTVSINGPFASSIYYAGSRGKSSSLYINGPSALVETPDPFALVRIADQSKLKLYGRPLRADSLSIEGTGILDLMGDRLILRCTPAARDQALAQIIGYAQAGRIISSARSSPFASIAVMLNDDGAGSPIDPIYDVNAIFAQYTYTGDANLDGLINADDYFLIDSGYITQAKGYHNGDFNYDGIVNADDYFLIDSAYIGQSGPLATSQSEAASSADVVVVKQAATKAEPDGILAQLFSMGPVR
ncbi:MAG: choice-of-anchor D domain-containing protein [Planctomycetota bacterium]|nr:choice-of-anchor D domain-containing protein [Planctomycetota bacterium]